MTIVGFVGLGIMGLPMAKNVAKNYPEVIGYNRSQQPVEQFVQFGGRALGSIAELTKVADVIITMLPDSPDVEAVVLGQDGILAAARPGQTIIDMSTIQPDVSRRLAVEAALRGVHTLDAPVSGGQRGAIDGTLSVMVGGLPEVVEAQRPILESMGGSVVHVGPHGAGQTVKAANQLIVAGNLQVVAEAIILLEVLGVDLNAAVQVLKAGLAGSKVLEQKATAMISGDFTPGFRAELHHKDLGIVAETARTAGVVTPVGALVTQLMAALVATGYGRDDHSALVRTVRNLSRKTEVAVSGS